MSLINPGRSPSSNPIPAVGRHPSADGRLPVGQIPTAKNWTFSWQYWRQIEYFGLDKTDANWFVSLLEKLRILSSKNLDEFRRNGRERDTWRFHDINWSQKNIPIRRRDLDWLDSSILDNDAEFPMVQFQVSQALGRIVGFFGVDHVFHIVLLDPHHNLQPSKSYNYQVAPCSPLSCNYSALLRRVAAVSESCGSCQHAAALVDLKAHRLLAPFEVVMFHCDAEVSAEAEELYELGCAEGPYDVFKEGIRVLSDAFLSADEPAAAADGGQPSESQH